MKRRLAVPVLLLLLTPLSFAGSHADCDGPKEPHRPEMSFRLSTYHGMNPLEVKLTAEIKNFSPDAMKGCWIQADWKNTTGVGLPFVTRKEIPCAGPKAEIKVPETFETDLLLEKAGSYSYRIILEDLEGERYASASREVKVFEGGLGLRYGKVIDEE